MYQTVSYLYFCNPIVLESVDVIENHDLHHPHIQYPTKGRSSEFVATVNNQFGLLKVKKVCNVLCDDYSGTFTFKICARLLHHYNCAKSDTKSEENVPKQVCL